MSAGAEDDLTELDAFIADQIAADPEFARELAAAEARAERHRSHLTDGQWHDDCDFCLERRRHGGDGIAAVLRRTIDDIARRLRG